MKLPTKEQLVEKVFDSPLLRLLIYERWFRVGFALFILIFIALALFLPKIWRTTKPDFRPVIKISGLDFVQAWSLKRTALKAAAAGKFEECHYAWQSALANNPADPGLVRGALGSVLQDPNRRQRSVQAIQQCYWLLRLTSTNLTDLELVTKVLEEYRHYDYILDLVEPKKDQLTPPLAATYLKSLFNRGRMSAFKARWDELSAKAKSDLELPLYRAAYDAGWGEPGTIAEGRRRLDAATADPALRVLAYRLKLILSAHAMNPLEYKLALAKLEELREDALGYHAQYWRLLGATGDRDEALRLIQAYPHKAAGALEAIEIAQTYSELGERRLSLQTFERYVDEFGRSPAFMVTYANELLEQQQWEDLRNLALKIRAEEGAADHLAAFSYFLEGRAELGLGRLSNANAAFQRVTEREFIYPGLGQKVALQLFQLNRPAEAKRVLMPLEKALHEDAAYWSLMFNIADRLQETDLLVRAAEKAYALAPNDPSVINNYAAALIITRQNPEQVIRLTLQLYALNPNSLHAIVNHSAALNLNKRPKEAEALLSRVITNQLNPTQLAIYHLDLFETYCGLEQFDRAWAISDRIQTDRLYPPQREWLETVRRQLPPRPKNG